MRIFRMGRTEAQRLNKTYNIKAKFLEKFWIVVRYDLLCYISYLIPILITVNRFSRLRFKVIIWYSNEMETLLCRHTLHQSFQNVFYLRRNTLQRSHNNIRMNQWTQTNGWFWFGYINLCYPWYFKSFWWIPL